MKNFPLNQLRVVLAGLSVLAVVLATGRASAADDYVYQGKSVKEWVNDLSLTNSVKVRLDARAAIKEIGTNALPFLMDEVRALGPLEDRNGTFFGQSKELITRRNNMWGSFMVLGPVAKPAVPELTSMLNEGKGPFVAARALGYVNTNAANAIFTQALTNPVLMVRIAGAASLHVLHAETNWDTAIPLLLQCLNDKSSDTNVVILQRDAASDLGYIGRQPEVVVPALIQKLSPETSYSVRIEAAKAIGKFGKSAQSAVPALESATNNSQEVILQLVVAHSIKAIEEDQKK